MTFREVIRFVYGLAMGTSTPFLKPTKRFLFPPAVVKVDEALQLVMGGSCVCALLRGPEGFLLINTNQGAATRLLCREIESQPVTVILSSVAADFSAGLGAISGVVKVLVGSREIEAHGELEGLKGKFEIVGEERIFAWGDERVHVLPVTPAATGSDLVVFFEKRSVLFAGALFYNHLQPVLRVGPGLNPAQWIAKLEMVLNRFSPARVVPGEGDVGSCEDAREFLDYLRALTNPEVEFRECRAKYDWPEIRGFTSLEENFDLLRSKTKSYTSLARD
jgi:glyoxylase-like metal-dependent hydrolase (beta-lactamase superfamily II)